MSKNEEEAPWLRKPRECPYMFSFGQSQDDKMNMMFLIAKAQLVKAKCALIVVHEEADPVIEDDNIWSDMERFFIPDENAALERVNALIAGQQFQVLAVVRDDEAHVLFLRLRNKTTSQKLAEKRLFKFAKEQVRD